MFSWTLVEVLRVGANQWEMSMTGMEQVIKRMEESPHKSEQIINNVLNTTGKQLVSKRMPIDIPVSKKSKRHARNSNPYNVKTTNLGLIIKPKGKSVDTGRPQPKTGFNYLKFPDLGIGTSSSKQPKNFMLKGLEKTVPEISIELLRGLEKNI